MASLNKVLLIGNLGADPDVRYTEGGTAIATLSLATNRRYRNRDNELVSETEWHRVVLFGRSAELAKDYLRKGNPVFIEGRLRTRKWTDQNGQDRWTTEIVSENMQFVGGGNAQAGGGHFSDGADGFESAPRPRPAAAPRQSAPAAPAPAQQPAASPAVTSASIDQLDEDVPF